MDAVICGILKRGKGVGVVREEVMAIAPSDLFDMRHRKHLQNEANMKNDSGPAFPQVQITRFCGGDIFTVARDGMSLRDWFAGNESTEPPTMTVKEAAELINIPVEDYNYLIHWADVLAKWRYMCANAMLKARE